MILRSLRPNAAANGQTRRRTGGAKLAGMAVVAAVFAVDVSSAQAQSARQSGTDQKAEPFKSGWSSREEWLGGKWQIGAIGTLETSPYRGADNVDPGGLPWIAYDADRLHVGIDGISAKVIKTPVADLSLLGNVRMAPFDNGDSNYLRGMKDRDTAFEGGIGLSGDLGAGTLKLDYLHDFSNAHDGQEADLSYKLDLGQGHWKYGFGGGVLWRSAKLNDYYVGVSSAEARSDRPAYSADSAFLPYVDASLGYAFSSGIMLRGSIKATWLPGTYTDSPIIEDDVIYGAKLGLIYQF